MNILRTITLALRSLPVRGRRVLAAVLHSRYTRVITHPLVAFTLFLASPFVLYYTGFYEATLRNEWLHNLNHLHFIAVGLLFYISLLALDPVPRPLAFPFRLMLITGVAVSHVLLGVPIK